MDALPEHEPYYLAIGRFVQEFSTLELALKAHIALFARIEPKDAGQILNHDFAMTCTIAENVMSRRLEQDKSAVLKDLIKRCRRLNDDRVRIVHGLWVLRPNESSLIHLSRQKLEYAKHYSDVNDVQKLVDEAQGIFRDFHSWSVGLPKKLIRPVKQPASREAAPGPARQGVRGRLKPG